MGRNTWSSLPRVLPGRKNIVISSQTKEQLAITDENVEVYQSLTLALKSCKKGKTFVIGGKMLYEEAVKSPYLESIYETLILHIGYYPCDVFFTQPFGLTSSPLKSVLVKEFSSKTEDKFQSLLKFSTYHVLREN